MVSQAASSLGQMAASGPHHTPSTPVRKSQVYLPKASFPIQFKPGVWPKTDPEWTRGPLWEHCLLSSSSLALSRSPWDPFQRCTPG